MYVDYKNVIKWNLKNALLCLVSQIRSQFFTAISILSIYSLPLAYHNFFFIASVLFLRCTAYK